MSRKKITLDVQSVIEKIYIVRGVRVMLDSDLAALYGVETRRLKEAVRRNKERFPPDFMFELTAKELHTLRSQFATSKYGNRGGTRYASMVFTEQGVSMLSSVLNSPTAVQVNIQIIRVFSRVQGVIQSYNEVVGHLQKMEERLDKHDEELMILFDHMKALINPPQPKRRMIGFKPDEDDNKE